MQSFTRTLIATLVYTESGRREEKQITYLASQESQQYTLTKVFVLELNRELLIDKETNEILIPE
jgi:hypothetical protein